jgi:hypothetical protein
VQVVRVPAAVRGGQVVRAKKRDFVTVRVPEAQPPFVHVPGGWFISVLWNYGHPIDVNWRDLRALLVGSNVDVVIARRMTGKQLRFFEGYRENIDAEVHARLIFKDPMRWWSPRKR